MKNITSLFIGGSLLLATSVGFATTPVINTDITTNWSCTTNASSPVNDTDKLAADQMEKNTSSAVKAFELAAQNCRDCTEITCKVKK
ncbi:MAG: hypothetical protein H0U73_12225 [Tatlockia sp.]|nr:hypothetical protein [Tatlockia sp.]